MVKIRFLNFSIFGWLLWLTSGCKPESKVVDIHNFPVYTWPSYQSIWFDFVPDLNIPQNLVYQIQYGPDFPYQNIWLQYKIIGPKGDTLIRSKDNFFLFQPSTGQPVGSGTKNRIFVDASFLKGVTFKVPGTYQLRLQHYLRADSLSGIQAIGLKIKKD